jgi:hypothetical protein
MYMKRQLGSITMAVFGLLVPVAPLSAHHTFSVQYDSKKLITILGKVVKVEWKNPHTYIYLESKDAKGKVANWAIEGSTPAMNKGGWRKDTLKKNDVITVTANPAKDGSNRAAGREVAFADGETLLFESPGR